MAPAALSRRATYSLRSWLPRHREGVRTTGQTKPSEIFARAVPWKASIVETYRFHQVRSVNPDLRPADEEPVGHVEIIVPLDGHRHFTRDALKDVQGRIGEDRVRTPGSTFSATIGHLVLTNFRDARRADDEPLADAHGAIQLRVPVRSAEVGDDDLVADQREATLKFDYRPPKLGSYTFPIQLGVQILDPEESGLLGNDFAAEWEQKISDEIIRQPAFSSELLLLFRVRIAWARRRGVRKPRIRIKNFSMSWPTVTSLAPRALRLAYGNTFMEEIQYNPVTRSLQWFDIPLKGEQAEPVPDADAGPNDAEPAKLGRAADPDDESEQANGSDPGVDDSTTDHDGGAGLDESGADDGGDGGDDDDYAEAESGAVWDERSEDVFLYVRQPGQLRKERMITGSVLVEVAGQLMSGIDARLFDATGARHGRGVLTLKTKLQLTFEIVLEDVFNRRPLSATHTLHFDEVVPDVQRIEDINAALRDRGFDVTTNPIQADHDDGALKWRIRATRAGGPDQIMLSILVTGRRYRTKRRSGTPGWHRYTSEIDSGELRLAIHGRYPPHSHELTVEVNALRQVLSSRFRHMAAQR